MMRVTTLLLALLLLLAAAGCSAIEDTNDNSKPADANDDAQIYAAAIREIHAIARSSGVVYLIATTDDLSYGDAPAAPAQELPADLQEAITAELAAEPYELIWIEAFDDAPIGPIDPQIAEGWHIAEGDGIIITLGNIHPQDDGSVQLSFFMTCADTCGSGKTYVLNRYFSNWHVTGSVGPEIAS
jgi:hypothetical protein